jgi:hypothetical protein
VLSLSHCLPEENSSALFCHSSRSLMRSESPFCVILCGSAEVTFGKNSKSLEVAGCGVSSGVLPSSLLLSRERLSGGGEFWNWWTFTLRHWTNSRWYIWALRYPLFLLVSLFLNRRHHTEVTVRELSVLLFRWALTRSYEIPSIPWKSESVLNS